jgi:hypothetical protein
MMNEDKGIYCLYCETLFSGRSGQKFCSDQCRFNFHNAHVAAGRKLSKSVVERALSYKRNCELLKRLMQEGRSHIAWIELLALGFEVCSLVDLVIRPDKIQQFKFGRYLLEKETDTDFCQISFLRKIRYTRRGLR